jgi:DNA-binding NarL/FixJ family response regulator
VSDPSEAASAIDEDADVVVVGMDSADWDTLGFLRWTSRRRPDVAMVAMSGTDETDLVTAALKAGAVSWVPKWAAVEEMAEVVVGAARGESSIPPVVLRKVLRQLTAGSASPRRSVFVTLTARERDVLELAVMGYSRSDTAGDLGLSVNTVRTHLQHILRKLGVHTTLEAVTLVLRERASPSAQESM